MRRVIRERIRKRGRGLDLALDLNADIAVNLGRASEPGTRKTERRDRGGDDASRGTRSRPAGQR
jgi:hypothetical protein